MRGVKLRPLKGDSGTESLIDKIIKLTQSLMIGRSLVLHIDAATAIEVERGVTSTLFL